MKYTSAEASKLLKQLQEERKNLLDIESKCYTFIAATTEDIEKARPEYDCDEVQKKLEMLEQNIMNVKHCINVFNMTHKPAGFELTVDQMLLHIPYLEEKKEKLSKMSRELPKTRLFTTGRSNLIEYRYVNYNLEIVKSDYSVPCTIQIQEICFFFSPKKYRRFSKGLMLRAFLLLF